MSRDFNTVKALWGCVPERHRGALARYALFGISPGGFLEALLSNDLRETFSRADEHGRAEIHEILVFLYNLAPGSCWGSPVLVDAWMAGYLDRLSHWSFTVGDEGVELLRKDAEQ